MTNFNIRKLSSLVQGLTSKEAAKVVIGYLMKQDEGEGDYENEIQAIVDAIPQPNISEYSFYWRMYMNVQQIILDYQTTYLHLQVQEACLSHLQYFIKISPLLLQGQRVLNLVLSETDEDENDLNSRILEMLQILTFSSDNLEGNNRTLLFCNDSLKAAYFDTLAEVRELIQKLQNYQALIKKVELKIFDGMQIVARKGLLTEIDEFINQVIVKQNTCIINVIQTYELFNRSKSFRFAEQESLLLQKPEKADEKWIETTYNQLIFYAERDSGFNSRI